MFHPPPSSRTLALSWGPHIEQPLTRRANDTTVRQDLAGPGVPLCGMTERCHGQAAMGKHAGCGLFPVDAPKPAPPRAAAATPERRITAHVAAVRVQETQLPNRSGSEVRQERKRPHADHPFMGVCGLACQCCRAGPPGMLCPGLAATPATGDSDDCHTWHRHDLLGAPGRLCPIALAPKCPGPCGRTFGWQVWVTAGFLWLAGRPGTAHLPGPWRCLRWLGARISGPWARWCARPG